MSVSISSFNPSNLLPGLVYCPEDGKIREKNPTGLDKEIVIEVKDYLKMMDNIKRAEIEEANRVAQATFREQMIPLFGTCGHVIASKECLFWATSSSIGILFTSIVVFTLVTILKGYGYI